MAASENLPPQIISRLMAEIRDLKKNPAEGIEYFDQEDEETTSFTYIPAHGSSVSEIHAVINGPEGTPFDGGKFLMKLVLSEDYPNTPPRGYFITKIYHPNVSSNGDICVNTLKKDWAPDTTVRGFFDIG